MRQNRRLLDFTSLMVGVLTLAVLFAPFSIGQNSMKKPNGTPVGWSDDINLSETSQNHVETNLAVCQQNVHVIWCYNPGSTRDILYRKSTDGGRTWGQKITLGSSPDLVRLPDIAISEDRIHVVWEDRAGWNGIYYRNSSNNGETWTATKRISSNGVDAYGPEIFVNNSNVHIFWYDRRDGTDGEVYYRRSLDGGITFDNGQGIDQDRRITYSPSLVANTRYAGFGSNLSFIWSDERNGNFDIYWMISKNNGNTWEDGLGHEGQDRQLTSDSSNSMWNSIAMDGSNIHLIWVDEQWPGPVYRLYYRNSTDNGVTWNPIQLLTGPVPGINSPDIDVQGNTISVVWDDERDDGDHEQIYYKNSNDGGITWSNDLRLTYNLSYSSYWPRIKVENDTKHVVWYNWYGSNLRDVFYKRSPDFPDASPPSHSNEIPLPDSYKDAPGTNISVHVTDPSGVNASSIQLWINGSLVPHNLTPITDGYNVSWASGGFSPGVVTCQIIAEDNLGNVLDYTWNFTVLANYIIPLQEGWNLISLPLEQVNTSVPTVLASIAGQYDVVKYYNCIDTADHWKTYRPGSSENDLTSIDNTMGFWIKITELYVNLTVKGIIPTSTNIPLYAGWNLVGYPTQTTETVGNALWGTGTDRVEGFDFATPYIKEVGPTYVMKPGEGYWMHVPADTVWVINW